MDLIPSFIIPMPFEQNGFKAFGISRSNMYWQGFFDDDNQGCELDLEFYLKYFGPRLARLLVKHSSLRVALRLFRRFNPWFIILTLSLQVFYLFPTAMYINQNSISDVVANFFFIVSFCLILVGACSVRLKQETIFTIFAEMDVMLSLKQMDSKEQRDIYNKSRSLCYKITQHIQLPFVIVLSILYTLDMGFNLLPAKKFHFRDWFPWETTSSPAFEITLFGRWIQILSLTMIASTLVTAVTVGCILVVSSFKILNSKLKDIRRIAIRKVNKRRRMELLRLRADAMVATEFEHNQEVYAPRQALPGDRHIPAPAAPNASRINSLALLRPLYEADELGSTSRWREMPLPGAVQVDHTTAAAPNANRINSLALLSPLYEDELGYTSGRGEMPREHVPRGHNAALENDQDTTAELDKVMLDDLAAAVRLHAQVIRSMGMCNQVINATLMFMNLTNTLVLGMSAVMLIKMHEIPGAVVMNVVFFTIIIMAIYLVFNEFSQHNSDGHEAVCVSIYNSDWTGASKSFKKSMLIMMTRANVRLEMKPTGLEPLSRKNFSQVMNSAYKMVNTLYEMM